MASYGVEFYSDAGKKFIIPSHSGFVFKRYVDLVIPIQSFGQNVIHTEDIGNGAQAVCFVRVLSFNGSGTGNLHSPLVVFKNEGSRLIFNAKYFKVVDGVPGETVSVRVYIFTNKETNPEDTGYGIKVFDENGVVTYHTSSRMLRINRANWGYDVNWSISPGHNVASVCNILGHRYFFQGDHRDYSVIPSAENNILRVGYSFFGTGGSSFNPINTNPEILYINTSLYD